MSITTPSSKEKEPIEFPIVRKECLGDCKFIKMRRYTMGAECKLCGKVYTSFSWKKHPKDANYQRTIICPVCAITKNLCQVGVVDLDYDIPAYVRDSQNLSSSADHVLDGNTKSAFSGQKSNVTNTYFAAQAERFLEEGGTNRHLLLNELANRNVLNELRNEENVGGDSSTFASSSDSNLQQEDSHQDNIDHKTLHITHINMNVLENTEEYIDEKTLLDYLSIYATAGGGTYQVAATRSQGKHDQIAKYRFIPSHHACLVTFSHSGDAELCMEKLGKKGGQFKLNGQTLKMRWARKKVTSESSRYEPYPTRSEFKLSSPNQIYKAQQVQME